MQPGAEITRKCKHKSNYIQHIIYATFPLLYSLQLTARCIFHTDAPISFVGHNRAAGTLKYRMFFSSFVNTNPTIQEVYIRSENSGAKTSSQQQ